VEASKLDGAVPDIIVFDSRSSDGDDNQTNDRFKKDNGYHVVPPPLTGNYMPPLADLSFAGLDDSVYRPTANKTSASVSQVETSTSQTSNTSVEMPRVESVRPSGVIIEDWVSDDDEDIFQSNDLQATDKPSFKRIEFTNARNESVKPKQAKKPRMITQNPKVDRRDWNGQMTQKLGLGFGFTKKACFVCGSYNHLIKDYDFHEKRMAKKSVLKNMGKNTVLIRFGRVPVSAAKHSSLRATSSTSTFRPVNTATHTNRVNVSKLRTNAFHKSHSPIRRPFYKSTAPNTRISNEKVNTVRVNGVNTAGQTVVSVVKGTGVTAVKASAGCVWRSKMTDLNNGNPQQALKNKGIFDSGCFRHMTGNKDFLTDYQDIDGGFVAFGGGTKGEFKNREMNEFCGLKGIKREFSVARTPQQNGVVKRKNRTLIEVARTMLADSLLPTVFWAKAVNTACYVLNRVLVTKPHNKTTYELIIGRPPSINVYAEPFGCPVQYPKIPYYKSLDETYKNEQTDDAAGETPVQKPASENEQALKNVLDKMMDQEKEASEKSDAVRKEVMMKVQNTGIFGSAFDDEDLDTYNSPFADQVMGAEADFKQALKNVLDKMMDQEKEASEQSDAVRKEFEAHCNRELLQGKATKASSTNKPTKIAQSLDDESRVEAMQEELLQFKIQKVWTLVDLPYGKKAIGTKWVYRSKKDERGIVMDVKSSFLYVTIEEEVSVSQPLGFMDPEFPENFYKVEKALYGLHQAPRAWYETLSAYLLDNGFYRGQIYKTLFIKRVKDDILLVQVYVDDIIFGSTNKSLCTDFEKIMHKRFQMSSMGEFTFFLGLQVKQKEDGIFISQDKYVGEILKKLGFSSIRTAITLMEMNKSLTKDKDGKAVDVHLYRSMIGSLMYLTFSRPDIMFSVCACSIFQVQLKVSYLNAVKMIFIYLKGQPNLGLWYPKDSPFILVAFSDSDYAGVSLDRISTTGGCQFLGSRLISWKCKKQTVVANSTNKDEYIATSHYCGQVKCCWTPKSDNGVQELPSDENDNTVWNIATSKIINSVKQIHAIVDGKAVVISESSVRSDLLFNDEDGGMDTGGSPRRQETMGVLLLRLRGYTPGSDEGRMKLDELITLCTKLSKQVLDLEKEKDAQAVEILNLKSRVKKLERKRKSSISHPIRRKYKQVETSSDDDKDFEKLDDCIKNVEEETVNAAATGVSTVSAPVSTAGVTISTAEPRTPLTTTTFFDNEDKTLLELSRPVRFNYYTPTLPTIEPKTKVKGVRLKNNAVKKQMIDQGDFASFNRCRVSLKDIMRKELAELERAQQDIQGKNMITNAA
ncbi:putative ribonuclease H-like domain-containing protein, partial [Tanacetum coccineum]